MNVLPEHLERNISGYFNAVSTINLSQTCQNYHQLLQGAVANLVVRRTSLLIDYYWEIINNMGGICEMLSYPTLTWKDSYLGDTGYIDHIPMADLTSKVMIGVDCYRRQFITLRLEKKDEIKSYYGNNKWIITLFQRYSDELNTWSHSCQGGVDVFMGSGHFLSKGEFSYEYFRVNIYNLLHNKGFVYVNGYQPGRIRTIENVYLR